MESLKSALERALKGRGLESELKGWDAVKEWPRIVGPRIASRTRAVRFHQGALEVHVEGSAWMQELSVLKPQLIRKMNRELGESAVSDLHLRNLVPPGGILR